MEDYNEYFINRKPSQLGSKVLRFWHKRMLKVVSRIIPDFFNKPLLEIGASHGFIADCCKEVHINYQGYEMNTLQARVLQKQGHDVRPARLPPIPPGKEVQTIWLSHVIEHAVNYREAKNMLSACYDRLTEHGYIVIIAPDILHWRMNFWSCDWSHGFPTSLTRMEQLLNDTGFKVQAALHHTATVTNGLFAWLISTFFCLFPVTLFDFFSDKIIGRRLFQAFMSVYGYRQILLIGYKQ